MRRVVIDEVAGKDAVDQHGELAGGGGNGLGGLVPNLPAFMAGPLAGLQTPLASALPGWNADARDCNRGARPR